MDNKKKINLAIMVLASFLFIFANIYAVRKIMRYGVEAFFYDKMLIAYQVGSQKGLEEELSKMLKQESSSVAQQRIARDFKERLHSISDPEKFLSRVVEEKANKVKVLRQLRTISFALILMIFVARIFLRHS